MDSNNWRVKRDPADPPINGQTSRGAYQQRGSEGFDSSRRGGYDRRQTRTGGSSSRDTIRGPLNDAKAEQAIEEGRRLYVGNMPYEATVKDVESLFKDVSGVEAINMSVDRMTGRNPSYAFVDFSSKELAEQVMEAYDGRDFMRRPLKVKPGVKSGTGPGRRDMPMRPPLKPEENPYVFERWNRLETPEQFNDATQENRRLYVGGLPRFPDQGTTNLKIRELFSGFNVEIVSKQISPHESKKDEPGNHYYCFVDLTNPNELETAISKLDGVEKWNWKLRVNRSGGKSGKLDERRRLFVGGLPEFADQASTDSEIRSLFKAFEVKSISKLFRPHESKKSESGNHHFCFVVLANEEQTDTAIEALDWKEMWGWKIRVKPAVGNSKQAERPRARQWGPSKIED